MEETGIRELGTIFSREVRVWVWPDHPDSSDGNIGSWTRPLRTLEEGKRRTSRLDVLIYIPPFTSQAEPAT